MIRAEADIVDGNPAFDIPVSGVSLSDDGNSIEIDVVEA